MLKGLVASCCSVSALVAAAGGLGLAHAAHAGPTIELVYANQTVAPFPSALSVVPGPIDGSADPRFTNFADINRSPNGQKWTTVATINASPAAKTNVLLIGQGKTGVYQAQSGVTVTNPGDPTPEFITLVGRFPRINDSGQWAHAFQVAMTPASTPASLDFRVGRFNGTGFDIIKPGDAIPALAGVGGGATYNGGFSSASITNAGTIGFMGLIAPNVGAFDAAFLGTGAVLAIEPFAAVPTGPTGQMTPTNFNWADITADSFQQDGTGTRTIVLATLDNSDTTQNQVLVVDGAVVIQKGFPIGAVPGVVTSIVSGVRMEPNGDWFARGTSTTIAVPPVATTWFVRNGVVIAQQGQPITPGAMEVWGGTFMEARGDNSGNYFVSGRTDNTNGTLNDVMVYNGTKVIARESDPVEGGAYFMHIFQGRSALLNDDFAYASTQLKASATGTSSLGSNSLVRIRVCRADYDMNNTVSIDDIFVYLNAWFAGAQRADMDGASGVAIDDIFVYLNLWFAGC